ncbi:unnamed protein product [Rotaria sp. Silwood2]|nr:unnamed protein product [Rotaria sp. Silwood2]CAF4048501.1 unnamed protein product [Rotaria sp. Silwood2]
MAQAKELEAEALDERSNQSAVERQTEASHKSGTIWEAVRKADQAALERLLDADSNSINARGPVGECPIHMLFLYGTEAHLNMAQYLITRFPETIVQSYNQPERWMEVHAATTSKTNDGNDDVGDRDKVVTSEKEKESPLWKRLNKDGFTPLTLAAKLGLSDMFSFLLDERKNVQWRYGPVSCVLYPLDEVDLEFQQEDAPPGALELIVQSAHAELIMHPRLIDLVDRKWERFARRYFFRRFLVTLAYLFVFLLTTILDQTRIERIKHEGDENVVISVEYPACLFCAGIIIVNIFRLLNIQAQTTVLALVSIIGWGYMLFFVMAFQLTGPFVVMIYEMLFHDVLRFCIIYMVFLIGFSQAFFVLFNNNGFGGFFMSVKQCFLGMLGDFDIDHYTGTTFQYASVSLLVIYVIVVTILLLNLLIAMMGDTYGNVIEGATHIWHLERARIVFAIENEMSTDERMLDENKYWTNVDGKRYLQIIRTKIEDHYLTKQHQHAVLNALRQRLSQLNDRKTHIDSSEVTNTGNCDHDIAQLEEATEWLTILLHDTAISTDDEQSQANKPLQVPISLPTLAEKLSKVKLSFEESSHFFGRIATQSRPS